MLLKEAGHVLSDCERDELAADTDSLHSVNSIDGFSDIFRRDQVKDTTGKQCCGSGFGIRCLFDPGIRDV